MHQEEIERRPELLRLRWWPILGFWAAFWLFFAGLRLLDMFWLRPDGYTALRLFGILDYAIQYALLALATPAVFWLTGRLPVTRRTWRRRVPLHVGIGVVVVLATMLVMFALHNLYAHPPGKRHVWTLGVIVENMIAYDYHYHLLFYLGVLAAGFALHYYNDLQRQQLAASHTEAQLTKARMQALRMQLHPHFLFNTLNTVSDLTDRDPALARRVIARLAELLRRTLESTREQEIPLAEELRFANGYLEIVRARFGERLRVETHVGPKLHDALVPTLILQPLLENAVEHGIARVNGIGRLEIEAQLDQGSVLKLAVRDNGPGIGDAAVREGVGVTNTRARLRELYGADGTLTLRDSDRGSVAEVTLPYHTSADLHIEAVDEEQLTTGAL